MCDAVKLLDGGGHLECDTPGVSHELHYDETDNVAWKDGRPDD